ncbi:hypothetical protein [Natronococcus roseus]|uniref:hypothetical protein n=1 Tax=Natronococcus roseus TaxID=1052014 RepID=UPI00374DE091
MGESGYEDGGTDLEIDEIEYEVNGTEYVCYKITYEIDGVEYVAWEDTVEVDLFERDELGYYIHDDGQATLPQISTSNPWEGDRSYWQEAGSPNGVANLSPENSSYSSSSQDVVLDSYLLDSDDDDQVLEFYFDPATWSGSQQFRFGFLVDGYDPLGSNSVRLRYTDGYHRIEHHGSDLYGGGGSAESFESITGGNYHRVVVDCSEFPYIEAHTWDAETGEFIDTVSGEDTPQTEEPGIEIWSNDDTEVFVDHINLIDEDDYEAGEDL